MVFFSGYFPIPSMPAPRLTKGGLWSKRAQRYYKWRDAVRFFARRDWKFTPYEGPVYFHLDILGKIAPTSDLSNHLKAWEDALQDVIYHNDRQIKKITVIHTLYAMKPGAHVTVQPLYDWPGVRPYPLTVALFPRRQGAGGTKGRKRTPPG